MSNILANQFRKPKGLLGKIVSRMMIKGNSREYKMLIREMQIRSGEKLFEIGYGHGWGIQQICSQYDSHVSGIDFSELMYKQACRRNRKYIQLKKVELFFGDFLNFEILPFRYDKIFCLNVIYFWDELNKPFGKIHESLKDEGLFCFAMAHRDDLNKLKFTDDSVFNKYTIEEVVERLKQAGFREIEYKYDWVYIIKCKK
jgi:SAM-dependent methyltransferase